MDQLLPLDLIHVGFQCNFLLFFLPPLAVCEKH